ncbi:hypothetical protein PIB30_105021, partial [Stylosanthes scabra]|nr:hypothetical protein [Stylosanthes scabra]
MGSDVLIPAGYRVSSVRSEPHWIRVRDSPIIPGTVLLSQSAIPWTQRTSPVRDAVTRAPGGSTRGRRGSTGATAPSHYTGRQTASVRHR